MNFSAHIGQIAQAMGIALTRPKPELISKLDEVLQNSRELLRVDSFDYWLQQIAETDHAEIPTTLYGVEEARRMWEQCPDSRLTLESALVSTSEAILTYCADDDMCEAQGDFHYYFYIPTGTVYKESDFGFSPNRPAESILPTESRIARISDLSVPQPELYNGS